MAVYQRPLRPDELMHFGVKGMKWGQRRYQNEDGTLTSAGRSRYNTGEKRKGMSPRAKKIAKGVAIGAGIAAGAGLGYMAYKNKKFRSRALTGAARKGLPGGKSLPAVRGRQGKSALQYVNDIGRKKADFKLFNRNVGKKVKSGLPSVVNPHGTSLSKVGGSAVRNGYFQPGLKRVKRDLRPLEAAGAAAGAAAVGYGVHRARKKKKSGGRSKK